jgi:hypothetical protein
MMVVNCLAKKQHHMKGLSSSLLLSTFEIAQEQLRCAAGEKRKVEFEPTVILHARIAVQASEAAICPDALLGRRSVATH